MKVRQSEHDIKTYLEHLEREYNNGDKNTLFQAIRYCGEHQVVMPAWLVDAFKNATDRWYKWQAKTLDDAFGLERKGQHKAAELKKKDLMFNVYNRIIEERKQGASINDELFIKIGKEFGIGKNLVKQYYAEARDRVHPPKK